jgi:hypothetical protein
MGGLRLTLVLLGLSGCGQSGTEPPSARDSPASVTAIGSVAGPAAPVARPQVSPDSPKAAPHHPTPAVPSTTPASDQREQEAWREWYAAARESSDVSVRLQALEQWAQRPGESLDPVTYGLVDQDETVRDRAQALWDQQLMREMADAP